MQLRGRLDIDPHHGLHVTHQGYTVLVTRSDGSFDGVGREGLWDHDTRLLSRYRMRLEGRAAEHLSSGVIGGDRFAAYLRVPLPGGEPAGPRLPEDALEVALQRRVGCGVEEDLVVRNRTMVAVETELVIELEADFRDVGEIGGERRVVGDRETRWDAATATLTFDFRAWHGDKAVHRALRVCVAADTRPSWGAGALRFRLRLGPHGAWRALIGFHSLVDDHWRAPPRLDAEGRCERDRLTEAWHGVRARVETTDCTLAEAFETAADDLAALRNWEYDTAPDAWLVKAGAPTGGGVCSREALTAAWQSAMLGPEMLRGTLAFLAGTRTERVDDRHDEEPGKLLEEIRRGPVAELDLEPRRAWYGGRTTPSLFVFALSEYWHWTGDDEALRRHRDTALAAMRWAEAYGDRDRDGFLETGPRAANETLRAPDGTLIPDPLAPVEEQAYRYVALQRMAEILVALGEDELASGFLERARVLRRRWDEAFWLEDERCYAAALDAAGAPVRTIGAGAGHALACGIVPPERARLVADRLLAPDLFGGWGVRTLSRQHPAYHPNADGLGAVRPVDQAAFALGMRRYGLDEHAERVVSGLLAAAGCFQRCRLPALLGGQDRTESPIPVAGPRADSPRAWSAGALIQTVQILLGVYAFAPAHTLALVHPHLPRGIDEVTLRGLRVGEARVSLRFERRPDGTTAHTVLERDGRLRIVTVPPPQDIHPDQEPWTERAAHWALEHAPGRAAQALRIALGDV